MFFSSRIWVLSVGLVGLVVVKAEVHAEGN